MSRSTEALAQVAAGAGMQGVGRTPPPRGAEAGVDFRESMRNSVALAKEIRKVTAQGQGEKTSKEKEGAGRKDASVSKANGDEVAATSKLVNASGSTPALQSVVMLASTQALQVPVVAEAEGSAPAVAGLKKSDGGTRGKAAVAGAKKDAAAVLAGSPEAGEAGQKALVKAETASVIVLPAGGREKAMQFAATPVPSLRVLPDDAARSSLKVPSESQTVVHASAAATETVHTIEAASDVLEVGLASPTHGWLRVRAELGDGGEVSAQVVTASAGAAENLHKELPQLSAYLASEQVGLSSLTVNAMDKGASAQDAALASSGGGSRGSEQESQRQNSGGVLEFDEMSLTAGIGGMSFLPASMRSGASGGWLSVRV